jgi:hypothetical protein
MFMWWKINNRHLCLSLEHVVNGATFNNLKGVLVDAMVLFGDLCQETISSKLITFGANGVSVFQIIKIGVAIQLKKENAPLMIGVCIV